MLLQENLIQPEEAKTLDKPGPPPIVDPLPKRIKSEALSPPPEATATPRPSARPNPLAPAQPTAAFIPLFNQEAARRRVTVEYLWEYAGQWKAKCIGKLPFLFSQLHTDIREVNGICKGEGSSSNKQAAKEEAARKAFDNMGWR